MGIDGILGLRSNALKLAQTLRDLTFSGLFYNTLLFKYNIGILHIDTGSPY